MDTILIIGPSSSFSMDRKDLADSSDNVSKELHYHGGKWATAHGSYFSDPVNAKPLVDEAFKSAESFRPNIIADIGGGTGFLLDQVRERFNGDAPRLLNIDVSRDQLDQCRGMDVMLCSALDLRRQALVREKERLMLISRSVMHYFGKDQQDRFLSSLRSVMEEGEMMVQQPASFATEEECECMNILYPMMGVDKFYLTPEGLRKAHERNGFEVVSMKAAPPLDLRSEDLADRYDISDENMRKMCGIMRRYRLHEQGFEVNDRSFRGPFTYVIVTARAI